jgi:DNA modification methylase
VSLNEHDSLSGPTAASTDLERMAITRLRFYPGNARVHSKKQMAGVNTLRRGRIEELAMHPTVKPVALVADAIRDYSRRGEIVLDPFGGSGTTLIAAEKTGRQARLVEFDPAYCDQALHRFEQITGKQARLAATGQSFEDVAEARRPDPNREESVP